MKNNFLIKSVFILFLLFSFNANGQEDFIFDVTEIEVSEKGNIFKGLKRGRIETNEGMILNADEFVYNKISNILTAIGNVKINDKKNGNIIYTNKITYFKNKNIITTKGDSQFINATDNLLIKADIFEYFKNLNKLIARNDVVAEDNLNNYKIYSNEINYFKNQEKIFSEGETRALINLKYDFNSSDVTFLKNFFLIFKKVYFI